MLDRLTPGRVGLLFALIGPAWIGGWAWWDSTRAWTPLDAPISLVEGHIHTPEFKIHVASTYSIGVIVNWPSYNDYGTVMRILGLGPTDRDPSALQISWTLSNAGRQVAAGNGDTNSGPRAWDGVPYRPGRDIGSFRAGTGTYVLDLNVLRDGSRLNRWTPHLLVAESGDEREKSNEMGGRGALLLWLVPIGMVMVLRAANGRRIEKRDAWKKAWRLTQPGPQAQGADQPKLKAQARHVWSTVTTPRRRANPAIRPPFTRPAWYGLVMVLCYLVIDIPVWLIYQNHPVRMGLPVRLLNPAVRYERGPGIQPVVVRLVMDHYGPHPEHAIAPSLFIDAQRVSWEAFDLVLREQLRIRPPNWPVYLEGDNDMNWEYAVRAIDKIRGLQAGVILLGSTRR